jgi:hypothetical protein
VLFQFEIKGATGDFEMQTYKIFNGAGQVMRSNGKGNVVDISSFAPGMYTIEVLTKRGLVSKKIVKY